MQRLAGTAGTALDSAGGGFGVDEGSAGFLLRDLD